MSLKTQFCSWIFQVARSSLTIFYCFNIHALISPRTGGIPRRIWCVRKSMISCVFCASVEVTALLWAEKISFEYWDKRILLISEKSGVRPLVPQKLISSYSWVYISVKRRNSGRNDSVWERKNCRVQISEALILCGQRKLLCREYMAKLTSFWTDCKAQERNSTVLIFTGLCLCYISESQLHW